MKNLLSDKTGKVLVSMSLPISIGMLSTFLFQIIDTYFVGQIGADALVALSFSSTLYFVLVGLFMGLSVGVSVIVGQAAGAGDNPKIYSTVHTGVLLSLALSALLSGIAIIFIDPIFLFLGAGVDILPLIREYTIPLLLGTPLLTGGLLIGGILRATGNVTKPEVLMAIAGLINLVFDYLLIFGKLGMPELGIRGAAIASVLSWVFIILGMMTMLYKDRLLKFKRVGVYKTTALLSEILRISTPTVVTQIIGPFTMMYIVFLLARQSSLAVAAFGVAGRIEMLLMIGILGVSTAITPFIAQNSGASRGDRIDEAIAFGGRASTYLGLLVTVLLYLFVKPIAGLFSDDAEVVSYTAIYFYIVSLSYVLYGLFLITTSIYNGLKLTLNSLKISLMKSLVFTVPLTLIGSFWGVEGIFISLSVSNVLAGLYAAYEMRKDLKKSGSSLKDVNVFQEYVNDFKRLFSRS